MIIYILLLLFITNYCSAICMENVKPGPSISVDLAYSCLNTCAINGCLIRDKYVFPDLWMDGDYNECDSCYQYEGFCKFVTNLRVVCYDKLDEEKLMKNLWLFYRNENFDNTYCDPSEMEQTFGLSNDNINFTKFNNLMLKLNQITGQCVFWSTCWQSRMYGHKFTDKRGRTYKPNVN